MLIGGLLAKAAIGSEVARNGLIGTAKGVGEVLAGIRQGIITVIQDVQKMTGNWHEPDEGKKPKKSTVKEGNKVGQ